MNILLYYHTIKYLKFNQFYFRIVRQLSRPVVREIKWSLENEKMKWVPFRHSEKKLYPGNQFCFLSQKGKVESAADWNEPSRDKLWLYNLHYFDDLNAVGASGRREEHRSLINRWINENPAAQGIGWDPYPSSLRIVNWIKAFLDDVTPTDGMLCSLAKQSDYLSKNLEFHLLGNHLLANAKALIFSGLYFDCEEARSWLESGLKIYEKEIDEQILSDGGDFELSPMYHAIILTDLLDLTNVCTAYSYKIQNSVLEKTKQKAIKMLEWLRVMTHSDGEVSFFNDSAIGIAPKPSLIESYASALDLRLPSVDRPLFTCLPDSGYSRIEFPEHSLLVDHARVGPDYLPAHAHADSLSIEWSVGSQRVLVNSGTSLYGNSIERHRQRQTASHNTVVVDGADSSQVWSGFRVAKRAYCDIEEIVKKPDSIELSVSHDGYTRLKGNVTHSRKVEVSAQTLTVSDSLSGTWETAVCYYHLYPGVKIERVAMNQVLLHCLDDAVITVIGSENIVIEDSLYHPQFGLSIKNQKLKIKFGESRIKVSLQLN